MKKISATALGSTLLKTGLPTVSDTSDWDEVADLFFEPEDGMLNFNTASAGIMPRPIYNYFLKQVKLLASKAPYEVKEAASQSIANSMATLANMLDVAPETLFIVRNTTEGINQILQGYPFRKRDEVLISSEAYPFPHYSLDRLAKVKKIKKTIVPINTTIDSDRDLVTAFKKKITRRTKLIVLTYMVHSKGNILPVSDIVKMAHSHGVEVLLDAAHAIGQVDHKISDLGCDYYVTSMHKWMYAPLGTGMVYVRADKLEKLLPAYSYPEKVQGTMKMFDYTGTVAFQNLLTLPAILSFHDSLADRKAARLKEMADYLREGLSTMDVNLPTRRDRSLGILTFALNQEAGKNQVVKAFKRQGIHIKPTAAQGQKLYRTSLNLHLKDADLDKFLLVVDKTLNSL